MTTFGKKYEESADSSLEKELTCSLCSLEFNEEKYLINHFKFCSRTVNSGDNNCVSCLVIPKYDPSEEDSQNSELLEETIILKHEPCEEESQDTKLFENPITPKYEQCEEESQRKVLFDDKVIIKQELCEEESQDTNLFKDSIIFKQELCEEESPSAESLDKHESTFDIKFEELDVTETTISTYPLSRQPVINPTTEIPEYLFKSSKNNNVASKKNKGKKLYTCKICDYSTTQYCHLKRHIGTHTGEKLFQCAICGHASSRRSGLTLHLMTHTGERPLKCDLCEYTCSQQGNLTRHMRTHTGEKPYQCAVCGHAAKQSGDIKKHMSTHMTTPNNTHKNKKRKRLRL